jgi:hypothetical protein
MTMGQMNAAAVVDAETEAQRNEMRMNFQLGAVECCH